jgi:hypothetical protein
VGAGPVDTVDTFVPRHVLAILGLLFDAAAIVEIVGSVRPHSLTEL